eukprot:GILI01016772.1.p1 GENE.GILI01016772.1~~GILI01016772.1.p1  ORF type:complete len:508 (+),score=82.74 GILI01016772.1:73-1596(+)
MSTSPSIFSVGATVLLLLVLLYDISIRGQSGNGVTPSRSNVMHQDHLLQEGRQITQPPIPIARSVSPEPPKSTTPQLSEVNYSTAPLALAWSWTGTVCAPKGVVGNEWQESCKEEKHKWTCDHFGLPGNNESKPSCGIHMEGTLNSSEPISIAGLERVREAVLSDIAELAKDEPTCAEVSTFGLPINRVSIYFDQDQVLHTRNCRRHHYSKQRGATAAAIMSYHASIIGKAEGRRGILFTGDSMMRQQFQSLVCMFRGGEVCMEQYFHSDSLYVLYKDRDVQYIFNEDEGKNKPEIYKVLKAWFPGYFEGAEHSGDFPAIGGEEPLMAILYLWDRKPDMRRPEQMRMNNLSLQITSYMYWWDDGNEKIDDYMRDKDKHLNANPHQTYVFLTMPWHEEDGNTGLYEETRWPRNRKTFEWIINKKGPSEEASKCQGPCRRWLIDYGTIADTNRGENIINRVDRDHYQCAWLQEYPQQVATIKHNRQGCRDPMNVAVLQWLLALLVRIQQ